MKKIYNFYQYSRVYEGIDMHLLPSDPIAGMTDLYGDMYSEFKKMFGSNLKKVEQKTEETVEKINVSPSMAQKALKSAKAFFGNLSNINIARIMDELFEKFGRKYDETDPYGEGEHVGGFGHGASGVAQKILSFIQSIFAVNVLTFGALGSLVAILLGFMIGPSISILISLAAHIIIHIIRKLLKMATDAIDSSQDTGVKSDEIRSEEIKKAEEIRLEEIKKAEEIRLEEIKKAEKIRLEEIKKAEEIRLAKSRRNFPPRQLD
jgi:hypothetical protein